MNRNFYYVKVDEAQNRILSNGLSFSDFMGLIDQKPDNILLLKSDFWAGPVHKKLWLDYVDKTKMDELIADDVESYGDFIWTDYKSFDDLDEVRPEEVGELLYMSHMWQPMKSPFFEGLGNDYFYLAHDDAYATRIYMKDCEAYKAVIAGKILMEMKGRRKTMDPLPKEILDMLYEGAKTGIVINFPQVYRGDGEVGVRIYKISGDYMNSDAAHDELERMHRRGVDITLAYCRNKWRVYGEWR